MLCQWWRCIQLDKSETKSQSSKMGSGWPPETSNLSLILGILLNWEEEKEIDGKCPFQTSPKAPGKKQNNYRDPKMTTRMWVPTNRHVSEINMLRIAYYYLSLNFPEQPGFEGMSLKIQVSCCGLWDISNLRSFGGIYHPWTHKLKGILTWASAEPF